MSRRARRPAPFLSALAILAAMAGLAVAGCSRQGSNTVDSTLAAQPQSTTDAQNAATAASTNYGNEQLSGTGSALSAGVVSGAPASNGGLKGG